MTAISRQNGRAGAAERWRVRIAACFANAGRTYTCGNALALVAASVTATDGDGRAAVFATLGQTFWGSIPALAMSFGSMVFFVCGAAYDRAHRGVGAPDSGYLRAGHALAAIGATAMAFGVAKLAVTPLAFHAALAGGALHVGGKLGAALNVQFGIWRVLPLVSRVLALVSLGADVAANSDTAHRGGAVLLAACVAIWARADVMLLADRHALWIAGALGLARKPPGE